MSERVVLLGAGGHAKVLIEALEKSGVEMLALADADSSRWGKQLLERRIEGGDDWVLKQPAAEIRLVNAIGSVDRESLARRREVFDKFRGRGYRFASVIHPSAVISPRARLEEGAQVMAGAVIQADACIGANTLINTRASVDHDCTIGMHVHIAPGAILSGGVSVGDGVHIGAGAVVRQGVRIAAGALIGAGAIVLRDVPLRATITAAKGETQE
jgi:sugar O-acyltransferase (sialic acid O-acetyltransferase NeuD family)